MIKALFLILVGVVLSGCAAALVVESNDPETKIRQATTLFNELDRPVAAVKLLEQAIVLAQKQGKKLSEVDAQFYLAEIDKSSGTRDGKLVDLGKALEHYSRATALYGEMKYFKRASFAYWNSSAVYEQLGNKSKRCEALRNAEVFHEKSMGASGDFLTPDLADGKLLESIRSLLASGGCR